MNFERGKDPKKTMNIGKTVFDYLNEHPVCKPMNDPLGGTNSGNDPRDPDIRVCINPHNQFSFNSSWCSVQDLWDWMDGKGVMVKGDTPEEKQKYWDYAVWEAEGGWGGSRWLVKYTWRWFDKFVTDFKPHRHGMHETSQIQERIKIPNIRTKNEAENHRREEKIIIDMYAPFIDEIVKDMEYREWQHIRNECEKDFYGIKRTLYCLGIGYMGACNTPEDIRNLNWVQDIVFGKAQYLYFQKSGMKLPDFEWLVSKQEERNKRSTL
jgi:hypothetical protein